VLGGIVVDCFIGFSEGLLFDGWYVGFVGWWGEEWIMIML